MNNQLAEAILAEVMNWREQEEKIKNTIPFLQSMARYKYDHYQNYYPGMRFIERLAIWLNQFNSNKEKEILLEFIKTRLIFISSKEIDHLVRSVYPDLIEKILINKIAQEENIPSYKLTKIINKIPYKVLKRKSLFLGLSDGARIDYFRRYNNENLSHEQIYRTHELSDERAVKMKKALKNDLEKYLKRKVVQDELKFKLLFLIDDFSGSGKSYFRQENSEFKGKIANLYNSIQNREIKSLFCNENLIIYIILYLCTPQALEYIKNTLKIYKKQYKQNNIETIVRPFYMLNEIKLDKEADIDIINLCKRDSYYDRNSLEDEHTQKGGCDVKLGFAECSLPIILHHNTPNNSISILWAYEASGFEGLFPRVPRHRG